MMPPLAKHNRYNRVTKRSLEMYYSVTLCASHYLIEEVCIQKYLDAMSNSNN